MKFSCAFYSVTEVSLEIDNSGIDARIVLEQNKFSKKARC